MTHEKPFERWNEVKSDLNRRGSQLFQEQEIWWCALGVNVGSEQDGKHGLFERPVLIFRKFNRELFWGLPMTGTVRHGKYYFNFRFHSRV